MNDSPFPKNNRILVIDDNQAIHADFRKILEPPTHWPQGWTRRGRSCWGGFQAVNIRRSFGEEITERHAVIRYLENDVHLFAVRHVEMKLLAVRAMMKQIRFLFSWTVVNTICLDHTQTNEPKV